MLPTGALLLGATPCGTLTGAPVPGGKGETVVGEMGRVPDTGCPLMFCVWVKSLIGTVVDGKRICWPRHWLPSPSKRTLNKIQSSRLNIPCSRFEECRTLVAPHRRPSKSGKPFGERYTKQCSCVNSRPVFHLPQAEYPPFALSCASNFSVLTSQGIQLLRSLAASKFS